MTTIAYLNGEYVPLQEARISPMDRGFLFGDGIYEVIPSQQGRMVGFNAHIARMMTGLDALEIKLQKTASDWQALCESLIERNKQIFSHGNVGLYLHVSRGVDVKRFHAYPEDIAPTIFGFAFEIASPPVPEPATAKGFRVALAEDLRWQRCNIKSTSLLGNVMHFQHGYRSGLNETILYNPRGEVTEASACNVFVVSKGDVMTPALDNHLLPGITRQLVIESMKREGMIVQECTVTLSQLTHADEVWLTSSTKEIVPVIEVDGKPVGDGMPGARWQAALTAFNKYKYAL